MSCKCRTCVEQEEFREYLDYYNTIKGRQWPKSISYDEATAACLKYNHERWKRGQDGLKLDEWLNKFNFTIELSAKQVTQAALNQIYSNLYGQIKVRRPNKFKLNLEESMKNKVTASPAPAGTRITEIAHGKFFRVPTSEGDKIYLRTYDGVVELETGKFTQLTDIFVFPNGLRGHQVGHTLAVPLDKGEKITVEVG